MKCESAEYKGQVAWEVAYTDTYLNQTFLTWGVCELGWEKHYNFVFANL